MMVQAYHNKELGTIPEVRSAAKTDVSKHHRHAGRRKSILAAAKPPALRAFGQGAYDGRCFSDTACRSDWHHRSAGV